MAWAFSGFMTLVFLHPSITAALLQRNRSSVHLETFLSTHHLARCETNLAHQQLKQTSDDAKPKNPDKMQDPLDVSRNYTTFNPELFQSLFDNKSLQKKVPAVSQECSLPNLPDVCVAIACDGSDSSIVHLTTMWCLEPSECQ